MGSSDVDFAEEEMELRPIKKAPCCRVVNDSDKFAKIWGWEMLLPYKGDLDGSDYCNYCNYLGQYYERHHSVITQVTSSSLVDAAQTCLKKEAELVSLWDSAMKECTVEILPRSTFILSSLIKEFADKVKCSGNTPTDVSTAALLCITKEADLICKMLSVGAKPSNYTIIQSTKIRMCALSLTSHQLRDSVPAAAAMLGIMKESNKICDWIRHNNKVFNTSDMNLDYDFELGRQVRHGTLHFMTRLLEKSPFPVSAAAADQGGRYFNLGNGDDHGVRLCTDKDRMALDSKFQDLEECDDANTVPPVGIVKFVDVFEKTSVWDRLLPLKSSTDWSDYCNYLRQYYKRNASVVAEVTGSLVASAEVCLKKEEELASLWKTQALSDRTVILPVITIAQSNLIQEHAHSFIFSEDGGLPVASIVAFACISKEAGLICELLKHGAKPTDGIIEQSIMIRMCALSLLHLQGSCAIAAAATMVGIAIECELMCDWIKKEDKLCTWDEPLECRLIRARTLDVMLSILKKSSFPSSKMWLDLVASN